MTMKIAPHIQQEILDANFERTPLSRQRGQVFLAYDSITIEQRTESLVAIKFSWHGKVVSWLDIEANLANGECVSVTGMEGKQQVNVS